jgi:enamine deaminase RidA (YjgF/YER057c/UK114 family)
MIHTHPPIRFRSFDCEGLPVTVGISHFEGQNGVSEYHLMLRPTEYGSIDGQLDCLIAAYQSALESCGLDADTAVFRRFFCSDLPNQAPALRANPFANPTSEDCAVSWVGQPPAPPAKVALWAYHISDNHGPLEKSKHGTTLSLKRGETTHHWTTSLICADKDNSYDQTSEILAEYEGFLKSRGMNLAENVIRTWFFVQNVDANYQGLVTARREMFTERGLTPETHYIASTGIEGTSAEVAGKVLMDAYAVSGIRREQIEFLHALDHLSPTHVYGVTFERGVSVAWRDRKHILISGTASIDRDGKIVHPGNVLKQLDRTLENVEALLQQAGAGLQDVCSFIVYVRDPSDLEVAQRTMHERFSPAPIQTVVAPVCRPGWLIEIECQAIVPENNPNVPAF